MSAMASQITSLTIVYSTVYSRRRTKETSKFRFTGLCVRNSLVASEFPHRGPVTRKKFAFDDVIVPVHIEGTRKDIGMALIAQFITVIMTSLFLDFGQGMAHIYERKVTNGNCDLVLTCNFHQVPVRSKVQCALFATSVEDSGFYYNSSVGICNICKAVSSATTKFTKINIDHRYFSESKWNSTSTVG